MLSFSHRLYFDWMLNAEALPCRRFQEHRVHEADEGEDKEHQLRVSLLNNDLRATQHSSPEVTTCTGFIAARVTAPIFVVEIRAGPTFCDPKSR